MRKGEVWADGQKESGSVDGGEGAGGGRGREGGGRGGGATAVQRSIKCAAHQAALTMPPAESPTGAYHSTPPLMAKWQTTLHHHSKSSSVPLYTKTFTIQWPTTPHHMTPQRANVTIPVLCEDPWEEASKQTCWAAEHGCLDSTALLNLQLVSVKARRGSILLWSCRRGAGCCIHGKGHLQHGQQSLHCPNLCQQVASAA